MEYLKGKLEDKIIKSPIRNSDYFKNTSDDRQEFGESFVFISVVCMGTYYISPILINVNLISK